MIKLRDILLEFITQSELDGVELYLDRLFCLKV